MLKYLTTLLLFFYILNLNGQNLDSLNKNNVKINSMVTFGFSLKTFGLQKSLPNNQIDSSISSFVGISQTVYLSGKIASIGGGIGVEGLKINNNTSLAFPIYLSTRLKSEEFPLGLTLKLGQYYTDKNLYNLKNANFFDVGLYLSPQTTIGTFGISYRKINSLFKNERNFSNSYFAFFIGLLIN